MDSASELELESDASSLDGATREEPDVGKEQLLRRVDSLKQENRVLRTELDTLKLKIKGLNEVNQQLRRNSVNIQARAEQEEEYISNTLLKKITELKKEKESLAINYEQEEECLTNELNRKFTQLRQEKVALERTLAREQEDQVTKLKSRIEKLEADMHAKQDCLDRLRHEKIELENALEQEQEALVNRLWKKMEKLEAEKRELQEKLESLGSLLSASSSNQSLASAPPLNVVGDGTSLAACQPSPPLLTRPAASSGPGSLRGSLRHNAHLTMYNGPHPVHQQSISPGPSTVLQQTGVISNSSQHTVGKVGSLLAATESRTGHSGQLNQSSTASGGMILHSAPPQSPMDIDPTENIVTGATLFAEGTHLIVTPSPEGITQHKTTATSATKNGQLSSFKADPMPDILTSQVAASYINRLRDEVFRLRRLLERQEAESARRMPQFESEERSAIEDNRRLRQMLHAEKERRETLSRQLSESESSLEMEDERLFNEACRNPRLRTTSDSMCFHPIPSTLWSTAQGMSSTFRPGQAYAAAVASLAPSISRCRECDHRLPAPNQDELAPMSSSASIGRAVPPNCFLNASASIPNSTICTWYDRCSPVSVTSPMNKMCTDSHAAHLPTSPATPTTASCIVGVGQLVAFAKPHVRMSATSPATSSYSLNEQLLMDCRSVNRPISPIVVSNDDYDEEDEDARCVTPPVCHSDSNR